MPIVSLKCKCGTTFDTLRGNILADKSEKCPLCGNMAGFEVQIGAGKHAKSFWDNMSPVEVEIARRHKADMERKVGLRDEGHINIIEKGPNEFRPFNNQPRRRFY